MHYLCIIHPSHFIISRTNLTLCLTVKISWKDTARILSILTNLRYSLWSLASSPISLHHFSSLTYSYKIVKEEEWLLQEGKMMLQEGRKEQIVLKPKMVVLKRDTIKTEKSKAISQLSRPKNKRRQQKETRHSPSKQNSNCCDEKRFSNRSSISF